MRVLHIDTGSGWRGGQQQVFWLAQGLRERGLEQRLLARAGAPLAERIRREGLEVVELAPTLVSLRNLRLLRRQADECDLLHAHDAHGHTLAWLACQSGTRRATRLVVSRRVAFPVGFFGRPKYAAADAYLAVSESARQQLLKAGVPASKVRVVHDGIPPPVCLPDAKRRAELRRHYGAEEPAFLIGTLTSLAPEKMLHQELDLLAALPSSVHFWLGRAAAETGAQSAEAALWQHAKQAGLEQRFRIFPLGDDLDEFLPCLDLFVYLSRSEGLGSAILRAMAYGLPVMASRVGGIPEIVRHQQTGLLVDHDSSNELSAGVRLLVDSSELRQRLGAAGREFVMAHATSDIMAARTAALYTELLSGSSE